MIRSLRVVAGCLFLVFCSVFASADDTGKSHTITLENQSVSIQAENASAFEVLKDLGEKSGIEVRVYEGAVDETINLNIKDLPLKELPKLLQQMNLNLVYGHEGDASDKIIYVLPVKKKGLDQAQGVSMDPVPEIKTLWSMEFNDVVTAKGSLDGQVILLDKMPHVYPDSDRKTGRLELIVHDAMGNKLWSRTIDAMGDVEATPEWDRILIETHNFGKDRMIKGDKYDLPSIDLEVFDRSGKLLGKSSPGHGIPFVQNDNYIWMETYEGGGGPYSIIDFSGKVLVKEIGGELRFFQPSRGWIVFDDHKKILIRNHKGKIILEIPKPSGTLWSTYIEDDYLFFGIGMNVGCYYYIYHIPTSQMMVSFVDESRKAAFALSQDKKRAAIITTQTGYLYLYNLSQARLIGRYDISEHHLGQRIFNPEGIDGSKNAWWGQMRIEGERIYMLGREGRQKRPDGTVELPTALWMYCWDTEGKLLWRVLLRDKVTRGAFVGTNPMEVMVWRDKKVEKLAIQESK